MWPFGKRKAEKTDDTEWIVVGTYNAIYGSMDADMAISKLDANGIEAIRLPMTSSPSVGIYLGMMENIRILVPPDRAVEAKELLAQEE